MVLPKCPWRAHHTKQYKEHRKPLHPVLLMFYGLAARAPVGGVRLGGDCSCPMDAVTPEAVARGLQVNGTASSVDSSAAHSTTWPEFKKLPLTTYSQGTRVLPCWVGCSGTVPLLSFARAIENMATLRDRLFPSGGQ